MASIPISADWTNEVYQIENGDPGTGGADGIANAPHRDLANRSEWLKGQVDALLIAAARNATHGPVLPIRLARPPGANTADGRVTVNEASGSNGGTVSITAGTVVTLSEEATAGATCREATWTTAAWTSAALAVNATYYLRARIESGALEVYVARGTDADTVPAAFKGTPNAESGGGFDSTPIDMLIARVQTGAAGSVPTVTELANSPRLTHQSQQSAVIAAALDSGETAAATLPAVTLNWARTPVVAISPMGLSGAPGIIGGWDWGHASETALSVSRYAVAPGGVQIRNQESGSVANVAFAYRLTATA